MTRSIHVVISYGLPYLPIVLGTVMLLPAVSYANSLQQQSIAPIKNPSTHKHTDEAFVFDSAFFIGSNLNQKALLRLSESGDVTPGTYQVDVYVNQTFVENTSIQFVETKDNTVKPCFEVAQLKRASVLIPNEDQQHVSTCSTLDQILGQGTNSQFDISRLRLDLIIPQGMLKQMPRGYVEPALLDEGSTIGFLNYYVNYYYNDFDALGKRVTHDSTYAALNGGFNIGKWQFRQQSSISKNNQGTSWDNIRSYVKRPLTSIQSELAAGQLTTTGRFFSGLSYSGLQLRTDERMLPDSRRGYAPVVQGIANSNAKVSIYQNGREIYQTSVAAGPFRITDLFPTSYNGDLNVVISEADGSTSEFRVPFSAVPESVRKGAFKYNFDIGRTRDIGEDAQFANLTTQYGLSNQYTLNSGFRVSEGYQSLMSGLVHTSILGAFGTELTYSRAKIEDEYLKGWMFGTTYSKTFHETNTTVALAGYRYSTEGYRDLSDVLSLRQAVQHGGDYQSSSYKEHSRATLILNQSLNDWGTIFVSGTASQYRDDKPDDYQLQLGYGKSFHNGVSVNFTVSRQETAVPYLKQPNNQPHYDFNHEDQTTYGLSISLPLDKIKNIRDLQLNYSHSNHQNAYQASIHGQSEQFKDLNYNVGLNYDDLSNLKVLSIGANQRFNYLDVSANFSKGNDYWQSSTSLQGALALHSGGITFGKYLSDTFALVEAKGAQGAKVINSQNTKIDRFGYALIPALTPYRFNHISLNPEGIKANTEITSGNTSIAPLAGSSVKIKFDTMKGYPLLIHSEIEPNISVPLGAEVLDLNQNSVGMVGQNGQIYLRAQATSGEVMIKWGDQVGDRCSVHYDIPQEQLDQPIIYLSAPCQMEY